MFNVKKNSNQPLLILHHYFYLKVNLYKFKIMHLKVNVVNIKTNKIETEKVKDILKS